MCGIIGVFNRSEPDPVPGEVLRQMLAQIEYRGPDEAGYYRDAWIGLGNARLSIIDLSGGRQPIGNEDGTLWIVFNGEVFNYVELRPALEARGHRFATNTDTEVVLHLYEEYGPACLQQLNGQFAIAIWDSQQRTLFIARDRLGIRPLFYTVFDNRLLFGSEIKTILAYPGMQAAIDMDSLAQVFTFWSVLSPRTIFRGIYELPPAHYALAHGSELQVERYWSMDFQEAACGRRTDDLVDELEALLIDATRIRLRADVPVGAYLSGGLDSSVTTALIREYTSNRLDTFSIAFADNPEFDESRYQQAVAAALGTDHRVVSCTHADIGRVFPDVVRHIETPVLRTAPAPMFLLSQLVHDHRLKVVMTGEGADEFLGGYDIFKEMKIRRFWARNPESRLRPLLLQRLYPDINKLAGVNGAYRRAFFSKDLIDTQSPYYSHAIRWTTTARARRFFAAPPATTDWRRDVALPEMFTSWASLAQAQYLESSIFLPQYLLSSQGDRVAMAHSVEGRYPFLDYRVVEYCNHLPAGVKMPGLIEKWLLRQLGRRLLPAQVWQRRKRPYRAPIQNSFYGAHAPEYVRDLLSETAIRDSGYFQPVSVAQLADKAASGRSLSETDEMALVGILSTQLVHQQFIRAFQRRPPAASEHSEVLDRVIGA